MTKNFSRKIEDFTCEVCGTFVQGNGYTNHCPQCLSSKHVDINPGDRACSCQGIMPAVSLETKGGKQYIMHQCRICGHTRRNKVSEQDNFQAILALSTGRLQAYISKIKE
ncbi:MAG: RNHCP domain-containing protein [Alphaproteobacteria bacterium]